MARRSMANLREVISPDRAMEILAPHEKDFRDTLFEAWRTWQHLGEIIPDCHRAATSRGRANFVYDQWRHGLLHRFDGRDKEGIKVNSDMSSLLVFFGSDLVVRPKRFDLQKRPVNYPTPRQQRFANLYNELPGMPPEATRVSVGYRLDITETEIKDIYVSCVHMTSVIWAYPIYEAVPANILFPEREAADFGLPPRPAIRPRIDEGTKETGR